MGSTDLIQLIDLSLGTEPSGVVNFNYLHALMHAIVKRLGVVEEMRPSGVGVGVSLGVGGAVQTTDVGEDLDGGGEGDGGGGGGGGGEGGGGGGGGGGEKGVSGIPSGASDRSKVEGREGEGAGQARKGASPTSSPSPPPPTSGADSKPPSSSGLRRQDGGSASRFQKSRSSVVTAANDLGALERKLQELESRLNAMDTLPELLERKSSDMGATPIRDRWNYTNLSKRLSAAEDSLDQSSKLVDDLLGEVQSLKSTVASCEDSLSQMGDKLSGDVSGMAEKMKALEDLKLLAAKDSMGDAATALLTELQGKMDSLQTELGSVKQAVDTLDLSPYVTSSDLQAALLQQTEKSLQSSTEALAAMDRRVDSLDGELGKLTEQIQELQSTKVNTADLASLMPKGDSGEAASLLPKIVELQGKLQQIEGELGKQPSLPPDVLDQIAAMQKAIDKVTAELASLSAQGSSGSDERSRLEELGSEVAQLRERLSELDRAVTALSNAVSASRTSPGPPAEEEGAKYVDIDSFTALQQLLSQQQQEQERLIGTAAHLSNELEINKEHVKSLYSSVDDLRANKADREEVEVEVREKADRTALEGKASRDWVDSTFERLDQQIREARDKLVGQEEALRSAVTQLNEDVETKLDRLELEPLKEYFDKKLARVKTAPAVVEKEEAMADDAAGFRKPLRFRCISCDKPLGVKPHDAIPALPSISSMPGTRSFRPYTTYELELIRRHQRMGLPVFGPVMEFSRGARSAGGSHTMTNPRRRIRVAPLSSAYSPDSYATPSRSSAHDEVEIVGQDGHIYKGRMSTRKLPPIKDQLRRGKTRSYGTPYSYQQ